MRDGDANGAFDYIIVGAGSAGCVLANRLSIALVRFMRRYMRQPILANEVGTEILPGSDCETDTQILDAFRRLSTSGLHGTGTSGVHAAAVSALFPASRRRGAWLGGALTAKTRSR